MPRLPKIPFVSGSTGRLDASRFYTATFPASEVKTVHHALGDYPSGKESDVLTVEFTALGISPCIGLNGGPDRHHGGNGEIDVARRG